jgi:hypothetical protein
MRIAVRSIFVAAGWFGASLFAVELPAIQLNMVYPPGGKAGSDLEVGITGAELEEISAMRFSHPGITAKVKAANRFSLTIAPDFQSARVCRRRPAGDPEVQSQQ